MKDYDDRRIKSNKAKCLDCGAVIESEYTHNYRTCPCGNLSVDGGKSYLRRLYRTATSFEELSEYED